MGFVSLFKPCVSVVTSFDLDGHSKQFLIIISNFPMKKIASKSHFYMYGLDMSSRIWNDDLDLI